MKHLLTVFSAGVLFAVGLGVSGMTNANKVIGFLNLAGDWDPSLAFVMVGAIGVHLLLFKFILRRESPIFGSHFQMPTDGTLDPAGLTTAYARAAKALGADVLEGVRVERVFRRFAHRPVAVDSQRLDGNGFGW